MIVGRNFHRQDNLAFIISRSNSHADAEQELGDENIKPNSNVSSALAPDHSTKKRRRSSDDIDDIDVGKKIPDAQVGRFFLLVILCLSCSSEYNSI